MLVGVVLLIAAVLVGVPAAVLRVSALARRHRGGSARAVSVVGVAWVLSAVLGLQALPGAPVASTSTAALAYDRVGLVRDSYRGQREFTAALTADPLADVPARDLLTGLRGRDVLVVFVESYGRVALEDPDAARHVLPALARDTATLRAAGFRARSGFLDSPTFGGLSWLAHSTLQSGLRVDHQRRYDALLASPRRTLASAFHTAGLAHRGRRTLQPAPVARGCPLLRLGPDLRRRRTSGTPGRRSATRRCRTSTSSTRSGAASSAPGTAPPVMAEIDLVSSHTPWAPLPEMVPPKDLGDGSVFDGMPARGDSVTDVWRDPARVRDAYGRSVAYSLDALTSFLARSDADPVVVVLGDHQPASVVSGYGASHDVPVSVLARDPAVLRRIADWGWAPGLRPDPDGPVRPMESFRDSFLAAYGPTRQGHTEPDATGSARR